MTAPSSPLTLVAHDPVDLLALTPVVLGFEPAESLVMLTFGSARPFHARTDLPPPRDPDAEREVVDALLRPARHHGVPRVVLIGYSRDAPRARRTVRRAQRAFERAGIEVIAGLCTDGGRWFAVPRAPGVPEHGVPYDLTGHRFAAAAVYDGRVVLDSRQQLRASVGADPTGVARVVGALAALDDRRGGVVEESQWLAGLTARHLASGEPPDDAAVARLLRGLLDIGVRDSAWARISRPDARDLVAFWSDVVRRAPDALVAAPASLLAFAAWQAGHGALAWCAVERAQEVDPDYEMARLVAEVLERAVPPDAWTASMREQGAG